MPAGCTLCRPRRQRPFDRLLGLQPVCLALSVHWRLQVVQPNAKEVFLQTRRKDQQRALQRLNEDAGLR